MKVIIGLGNPGEKYKNTRHNIGFDIVDILADSLELNWQEDKKRKALVARNNKFTLIKPISFMNLSGEPVRVVLDYYKMLPRNFGLFKTKDADLSDLITVVHDDLDIEFGTYKISVNSRSAGHNGVQSIIKNLKTKNFTRYRVGIKNDKLGVIPREKFVLQRFNREEQESLVSLYDEIVHNLEK